MFIQIKKAIKLYKSQGFVREKIKKQEKSNERNLWIISIRSN